jgi:hypothetical protein
MGIIMLCSLYGANTMKNKREIQWLLPQTHSPKVDYSLFIMVMKVESLERVEITPAAPHRIFSPLIFVSQTPVSWFCVLVVLPFVTCRGTLYIVTFRSRRIHQDEDRQHWSNEGVMDRPHTAKESGCVGHAPLALVPPLLHFLRS